MARKEGVEYIFTSGTSVPTSPRAPYRLIADGALCRLFKELAGLLAHEACALDKFSHRWGLDSEVQL